MKTTPIYKGAMLFIAALLLALFSINKEVAHAYAPLKTVDVNIRHSKTHVFSSTASHLNKDARHSSSDIFNNCISHQTSQSTRVRDLAGLFFTQLYNISVAKPHTISRFMLAVSSSDHTPVYRYLIYPKHWFW